MFIQSRKHKQKPRAGVFIGVGVGRELCDGLNKNVHLAFPYAGQSPRVTLCSKTYHKANTYIHTKIKAHILKKPSGYQLGPRSASSQR